MTKPNFPDYQPLLKALGETTFKLHPAEAHGLICGVICGNIDSNKKSNWEELVTGGDNGEEAKNTHTLLQALHDESKKQLTEILFEFKLLLPDDSEELPHRAEALTLWCQGFLTGLKASHVQMVNRSPSELTEAINDLIEIAKMNYEEVVASEEDEAAYIELVEYVRVAVILIYEDLREVGQQKKSASNHLH